MAVNVNPALSVVPTAWDRVPDAERELLLPMAPNLSSASAHPPSPSLLVPLCEVDELQQQPALPD